MRKLCPLLTICLLLYMAGCASTGSGLDITLDEAIQIAANEISAGLAEGVSVAVINFSSPSERLSDYVMEELIGKLTIAKKLRPVERSKLELIRAEMDFQLSGDVSDESAQAIGKMLGAQAIVTGSLVDLGANYRFRAYALNVESAVRETATLLTVRTDSRMSFLRYGEAPASAVVPAASSKPSAPPPAATAAVPAAVPARASSQAAPNNMMRIEGGTFTMGSPAREPSREEGEDQHQVTVSSFFIGKYEVTQKEYEEIMGVNPSYAKGDNLPVEKVSWDDAIDYCNKRSEKEKLTPVYARNGDMVVWNTKANGYRLPTEAEWEYACRAGTATPFSTGGNITTHEANYNGRYPYNGNAAGMNRQTTMPVGSFPPNPWGLYDMHGNVCEWVWDWYDKTYSTAAQTDPQGPSRGWFDQKTARGGGWAEAARNQRSAARFHGDVYARLYDLGFRIARSVSK